MSINIEKLLNSSCVVSEYCNRYTVCWQERPTVFPWEWKYKTFARKQDAKRFARRKRKTSPRKPYITKDVVLRTYFRSDVKVEYVKEKDYDHLL